MVVIAFVPGAEVVAAVVVVVVVLAFEPEAGVVAGVGVSVLELKPLE